VLHDILVDLLPKVDLRVRRQLSEQLSAMQKPPAELLSLLVHDVIEVSGPLLDHAAVSEEDLIDIVKVGSDAHREKISHRPHLSPRVRAALEKSKQKDESLAEKHTAPPTPSKSETTPTRGVEQQQKSPPASFASTRAAPVDPVISAPASAPMGVKRVFEDIIRSTVDWTWETGRDGEITYLSDASIRAFGRPARSLTGFHLADYCSLTDNTGPVMNLQDLLGWRRPFRNLVAETRDTVEQHRLWSLCGVPGFDLHNGRFTGFRGTAREMTGASAALSLAEAPLLDEIERQPPAPEKSKPRDPAALKEILVAPIAQNIDKNAADMIQNLSHELRTPLNAILGFSEMIDHETWGPVSEKYHDKTKIILRSAQNLKNAITDVLDVAKIRAGKQYVTPKFFSLAAILRTSLNEVRKEAEAEKVTLSTLELAIDIPLLNDPDYLERCIVKMLTYVIHRATAGENLWLKVERSADRNINIDIPLLGPPPAALKSGLPAREKSAEESEGSTAFALSVAADLALAIGGEIRLITQADQTVILRLTVGDYPVVTPELRAG
jgi:signal transduction histidine kinase